MRLLKANKFLLTENGSGKLDEVDIEGDKAGIKVLKEGLDTPTSAILVGGTIYVNERKIGYVRKPELKGKDPGPFKIWALPAP
jgi:hypothetical protein